MNLKFGFSLYPTLVPLIRGPGTKPHCSNRAGYQLMPFITARDHWMVNIQDLFGLRTRFVGRQIIENTRLLFWMKYIKAQCLWEYNIISLVGFQVALMNVIAINKMFLKAIMSLVPISVYQANLLQLQAQRL